MRALAVGRVLLVGSAVTPASAQYAEPNITFLNHWYPANLGPFLLDTDTHQPRARASDQIGDQFLEN